MSRVAIHAAKMPDTSAPRKNDCPVGNSSLSHCVNSHAARIDTVNWNQIMPASYFEEASLG